MEQRVWLVEKPRGDFQQVEMPRPTLAKDQVLVRISASTVNPLDIKIRQGSALHAQQPLPAVLGLDMAGTVEEVGRSVTAFSPGDEVYGMVGGVGGLQGTLAHFIAVDADLLARKPKNLSMRQAAALPLSTITAWEGLVDRAKVHADQKVLIQAGASTKTEFSSSCASSMATKQTGGSISLRSTRCSAFRLQPTEQAAEKVIPLKGTG